MEAIKAALDVTDGEAILRISWALAGHDLERKFGYGYKVKTMSLYSLLNYIGEDIDLIKMDIERAEFRILRNCDERIFNHVKQWIVECHSYNSEEEAELEAIFEAHDYCVTWLEPNGFKGRHIYALRNS